MNDKDFSFESWQNEKDIQFVCERLLDNADMDIEILSCPLSVKLTFFVVGSDIKVIMICTKIRSFSLDKEATDEALYVVLETHVSKITHDGNDAPFWEILVLPKAKFKITCEELNWSIERITESEISQFS